MFVKELAENNILDIGKFRTWDKTNKKFSRVNTFIDSEGNFYADLDPYGVDISGIRKVGHREQYCFAGRYTGKLDKSGTEIYGGDILKWVHTWESYEPDGEGWEDRSVTYTEEVVFQRGSWMAGDKRLYSITEKVEIIGNIYVRAYPI